MSFHPKNITTPQYPQKTVLHVSSSQKTVLHVSSSQKTVLHISSSQTTVLHIRTSQKTVPHVSTSQKTVLHVSTSQKTVLHIRTSQKTVIHIRTLQKTVLHVSSSQKSVRLVSTSKKTVLTKKLYCMLTCRSVILMWWAMLSEVWIERKILNSRCCCCCCCCCRCIGQFVIPYYDSKYCTALSFCSGKWLAFCTVHGTVTALVQFVAADGRVLFIHSWSLSGTN